MLAAACATDSAKSPGPDWSQSQIYNVTTGHSDRVSYRVLGNEKDGFDYHGRIRHTTRSDTDALDRQRVLKDASRTLAGKLCPKGATDTGAQYASNNYEQIGRFVCAAK